MILSNLLKRAGIAIFGLAMAGSLHAGNHVYFMNNSNQNWTLRTVPDQKRPEKGRMKFQNVNSSLVTTLGNPGKDTPAPATSVVLEAGNTYDVVYSRDEKRLFHLFTLTSDPAKGPVKAVTVSVKSTLFDAFASGFGDTPPPIMEAEAMTENGKLVGNELLYNKQNYLISLNHDGPGSLLILSDEDRSVSEGNGEIINATKKDWYLSLYPDNRSAFTMPNPNELPKTMVGSAGSLQAQIFGIEGGKNNLVTVGLDEIVIPAGSACRLVFRRDLVGAKQYSNLRLRFRIQDIPDSKKKKEDGCHAYFWWVYQKDTGQDAAPGQAKLYEDPYWFGLGTGAKNDRLDPLQRRALGTILLLDGPEP
jgi:hypothetical protein